MTLPVPPFPPKAKVLVTGIGGFLAGHIARQLLARGYSVRGTVRTLARAEGLTEHLVPSGGNAAALEFAEVDLLDERGWETAIMGCNYVIHTASPFPAKIPDNEDELIRPAREGTLRVLETAHEAGVRRVVLTSSIAATNYGHGEAPFTEEDWTDPEDPHTTAYYKSKTLAERAAWDYARQTGLELVTINPALILGPVLGERAGTSVSLVRKLLRGDVPLLPRFGVPVVDVRDVADLHICAMLSPAAAGQRFIAGGPFLWLTDIAEELREAFPDRARRIPQRTAPNWLIKSVARFDAHLRLIRDELGTVRSVSFAKAQNMLGWKPRPVAETIRATGQSLIDAGLA